MLFIISQFSLVFIYFFTHKNLISLSNKRLEVKINIKTSDHIQRTPFDKFEKPTT